MSEATRSKPAASVQRHFDESRLVQPGEWDDFDEDAMVEAMASRMSDDMASLRKAVSAVSHALRSQPRCRDDIRIRTTYIW